MGLFHIFGGLNKTSCFIEKNIKCFLHYYYIYIYIEYIYIHILLGLDFLLSVFDNMGLTRRMLYLDINRNVRLRRSKYYNPQSSVR